MAHYSNIHYSGNPTTTNWNNIELSPMTVQERNRLKWGLDDFTSFKWRNVDAFKVFGAFIINNRNLKFYNGPAYSNEYTRPQFETAAGQLTGVTFQVQKISFSIGVYWISEEDYRKLIHWLHPYEINTLEFGFEPNYHYQVKLASVEDGTRTIVGQEDGNPRYYTEMKLTFEIQGAAVAYGNTPFNTDVTSSTFEPTNIICELGVQPEDTRASNLETPLIIKNKILLDNIIKSQSLPEGVEYHLLYSGYVTYDGTEEEQKLFEVELKNLALGSTDDNILNEIDITYDSDAALLFWDNGGIEILTRLSSLSSGDRLVDNLFVEQFKVPGNFNDWEFDIHNMRIRLQLELIKINDSSNTNYIVFNGESYTDLCEPHLEIYPRTNLI